MSFLFDVIIIGIIVFSIYKGVSRGFVKSVMKLLSIVIAFLAAYTFTWDLARVYNDNFFFAAFTENVSQAITPVVQKTGEIFDLKTLFSDMPDAFKDILQRFGANTSELEASYGTTSSASAETIESMSHAIAEPISKSLSNALAFITIFIVSLIILAVATWLIDLIFKLPILKNANKFFGFLLGLIFALFYAYVFSELAVIVINAGIAAKPEIFNENIINNSILLKFFSGFSIFGIA